MPTTSSPVWSAPHNGIIGDASATAGTAAVNQFLGTHPDAIGYQGSFGTLDEDPVGVGGPPWFYCLATEDVDQPFTAGGTTLNRVQVPLLCVGQGADLLVSLCADSSGKPGSVICQTRIPASWIYQLSAVSSASVPATAAPILQYTGNPLAVAQYNTFHAGVEQYFQWSYPAPTAGGPSATASSACFGSYFIQVGGNSGSAYFPNVYTIGFDTAGHLAQAVPQPSIPVGTLNGGLTVSTDSSGGNTVVLAGGQTSASALTSAVYTAGFDATAGTVAAWTAQQSLPAALSSPGMTSYNGYVYVVGGASSTSGTAVKTVYYAQVNNGQITTWTAGTPLPTPLAGMYAFAVNGFLFAYGGNNPFGPSGLANSYYAPINADGSIGTWLTGPNTFSNGIQFFCNSLPPAGNYGLISYNSEGNLTGVGVTAAGPDVNMWLASVSQPGSFGLPSYAGFTNTGAGTWLLYLLTTTGAYYVYEMGLTPLISVPLPTSSLVANDTYHVLLQQQGGDGNNYLRTLQDNNFGSGAHGIQTVQTSPRGAYTWTTDPTYLNDVPMVMWDNQVPGTPAPGMPWHTWEDNGARITTLINATTPDQRFLGMCEAVRKAVALNANTGFEAGIAPWTVAGGTVARSTTEVYTGQYAAQITPSGTASQVYLTSENLTCMPGQSVTVTGWMWFTSAVTGANASLSVNWLTLAGGYISTSSNSVTAPAGTWTQFTNTFTAPAGAYAFTVDPVLGGTPAAAQIFYVDTVHAHLTYGGPQVSTVTMVNYAGTYPNPWPATGTTQLA